MITQKRFNNLNKGDILLFSSGRKRTILNTPKLYFKSVLLRFQKIKGYGTTCYNYYDIRGKIVGVFKVKIK